MIIFILKHFYLFFLGDWMASNVSDIRDVDELEVYGNERLSSVMKITSYVFEVSSKEFYAMQ